MGAPAAKAGLVSALALDLRALARLSGPVIASRVGIMTMGLADAIVVGRFSAVQLGYHAIAWSMTMVVVVTAFGLLSGIQVMAARALGEGRAHEAGSALRRGGVYAVWIGLGSMGLLLAVGPALLNNSGLSPDLAHGAQAPLIGFALSLPVYVLSVALGAWLEAIGRPGPVMVLTYAANLVNLAVVLILVPGNLGAPALGAVGAAIATLCARSALTLALLAYIVRMPNAAQLGVFVRPPADRLAEIEQRRIGYGAGASGFFEVAAFSSMTFIAGVIGARAVAAYAVVMNVISFEFMIPLGLSVATGVLVARAYGAGRMQDVTRVAAVGFAVTAAFGILAGALIWWGAGQLAGIYTHDPVTLAVGAGGLALASLFLMPDALQVVIAQALRARGDVLAPTMTHLASYILVMIPLGWGLAIGLKMGVAGLIWAIILASFASGGLLLGRFFWLSRRR